MNRVYCRRRSSDVVRQKINHFASRPLLAKWPSINALVAIWHWRNRWRRLRSCPTHPSRDASFQPFLPFFLLFLASPPLTSDRFDETRRSRDAIDVHFVDGCDTRHIWDGNGERMEDILEKLNRWKFIIQKVECCLSLICGLLKIWNKRKKYSYGMRKDGMIIK